MKDFIVFPACRLLLPVKTISYFRIRRQWRAFRHSTRCSTRCSTIKQTCAVAAYRQIFPSFARCVVQEVKLAHFGRFPIRRETSSRGHSRGVRADLKGITLHATIEL
ncbi:hypothetical protein [Burkholderia sp. PU8-34]